MKKEYKNRNSQEYKRKKGSFIEKKDNVIHSLKEVENFLWNWKRAVKGIKLYKIIKK